jgi:hypothetical protein
MASATNSLLKGPFAIRRANALSFIVAMLEALEKSDAY